MSNPLDVQGSLEHRTVEDVVEHTRARARQRVATGDEDPVSLAYAKGISVRVATDAGSYIEMTLREIAEEWNVADPIDLLKALDDADQAGRLSRNEREVPS